MSTRDSNSVLTALAGMNLRAFGKGAFVLGGILLACLASYPYLKGLLPPRTQERTLLRNTVAEVELASGEVSVRHRSSSKWEKGRKGMQLSEGDLIKTGGSGKVRVIFANGTPVSVLSETVFSVRSVPASDSNSSVPLSLSAGPLRRETGSIPVSGGAPPSEQPRPMTATLEKQTKPMETVASMRQEVEPTLEVKRIISFGKSIELIGSVDPGNRLYINDESVDVAGDGSFKHFTKPFPRPGNVQLVLKTIDLAGRVRSVTRTATVH